MAKRDPLELVHAFSGKTLDARAKQLANLRKGTRGPKYKRWAKALPPPLDRPEYKHDICLFAEEQFFVRDVWDAKVVNADTGRLGAWVRAPQPIKLLAWHKEELLRPVFHRRPWPTLAVWGMPKKGGKTTLAAIVAAWFLFVQPHGQEIYIAAKAKAQAASLVFRSLRTAISLNPRFGAIADVQSRIIKVEERDSFVECLGVDTSASGRNPSLTIFDELWTYEYEYLRTFYDELTTVPTRAHPLTLIVSYAGTDKEGSLLGEVCRQGEEKLAAVGAGEPDPDPRMFYYWTHSNRCPWQTAEYLRTQRRRLRRPTYLRLHEARWTAGAEAFCSAEELEPCFKAGEAAGLMRGMPLAQELYVGIDVGTKHDCAALVAVAPCEVGDHGGVKLVDHAVFVPPGNAHLDLSAVIDVAKVWFGMHNVMRMRYDPYQMVRVAQELGAAGVPMQEYKQTVPNLTQMHGTLHEHIKQRRLLLYREPTVKQHILNAHVKEHPQGWRLVKQTARKKIDLAIALAMAVQGCAEDQELGAPSVTDAGGEEAHPYRSRRRAEEAWMRDEF